MLQTKRRQASAPANGVMFEPCAVGPPQQNLLLCGGQSVVPRVLSNKELDVYV